MQFKITKIEDKIAVEVLRGNNVLFTRELSDEMNLEEIKQKLKRDALEYEVHEKENEKKEEKKNELKKLINKKIDL